MDDRQEALRRLAAHIERAGLRGPAMIALDLLCPLDVIASQLAIFSRPFVRGTHLDSYAQLLAERTSWQELHGLLSRQ